MFSAILALILGFASNDQEIIDAIVKARIELAKQPAVKTVVPEPKTVVSDYGFNRQRAINEGKVLLVLIGGSEVKQCTEVGCKPIPSTWIRYRCNTFTLDKEVIKTGIIVSVPRGNELYYYKTVPDQSSIDDIDNIVNPTVTVKGHWISCPSCPGGKKWID